MNESINISANQIEKPEIVLKDSRGTGYYTGARVAYNRSGNVIIGTLVEISKNDWIAIRPGSNGRKWWRLKFEAHVESESGVLSKIKNPNGLIVI